MVQNPIIAIDGFASTGKSTVARALSQHFRLPFIDSGAFYRGITLFAIENGFVKNNKVDQGGLEPKLTELDILTALVLEPYKSKDTLTVPELPVDAMPSSFN